MDDESRRYEKYQHDQRPIAVQHQGMFVFANRAFLRLLGYDSLEDLLATPVLDLVAVAHRSRLREHFAQAAAVDRSSREHPEVALDLLDTGGQQQRVSIRSFGTRYEGEEAIEFRVYTAQDFTLASRVRNLPWRLYASVLFLLAFTFLPNALLLNLNINNAPKVYLPEDAPSVLADARLRAEFPGDQSIALLFEGVALYSEGFLTALDQLAERIGELPQVDDVMVVTRQDHISGTEDGFIVEPLIDLDTFDDTRAADRQERAISDELMRSLLIAEDGSALAMLVIPVEINDSLQRLALEEAVLQAVADERLSGYLTHRAGQVSTDVAHMRAMLRDNMIFIPATTGIGLLLVWWLFRRWLAVVVSAVVIGVVVSSTVAIYVLLDEPFNLISSIIPPLLSALTVAALVHLFNALHYVSKRGLKGPDRVATALAEIRRPALFTSLTTAAGLASLALSPIPPIAAFGLNASIGVMLIYFVVIHLVPNFFARFDYQPWPDVKSGMLAMDYLVRAFYHLGMRYPLAVVGVTLVLLGSAAPQIANIVVETNLQRFFYPDHALRQDTDYIEQKLVGTVSLDIALQAEQRDGLKSSRVLKAIDRFQQWAEAQPEIDKSLSLADFVKEMHWGFNEEDPAFRAIPDDDKLISQYLLVYDGNDLYDFVNRDFQLTHVSLNVNVHGANAIEGVMQRIRAYLDAQPIPGVSYEIAGFGRMFADQEDLLVQGQLRSLSGALLIIFVLMLVQWRSFSGSLISMIPNLSPILLIFILMGIFGIWLDMATAMIASVAVGIAVDDTIHIYHGFLHRLRAGVSPVTALARTYSQAGRAVVTTTIILSSQFAVVTVSQFVPTTNFGLLTCIGLVSALVFDLVLLPAILILIYGRRRSVKSATA